MRRLLRAGLLLALCLTLPSFGQDKKTDKNDAAKLPKDQKAALDKLTTAEKVTGKLVNWGEGGGAKSITLQITLRYAVVNNGEAQAVLNLQQQLTQIAANPQISAQDKQNQLAAKRVELAQHQMRLYDTKEETKNFDFLAPEDMKVRLSNPPAALDEKGNVKKYSKKELDELKGPDHKLPGYTGSVDNLQNNQKVEVYLKKKPAGKPAVKDKDAAPEKREVSMIVVLADPPPAK